MAYLITPRFWPVLLPARTASCSCSGAAQEPPMTVTARPERSLGAYRRLSVARGSLGLQHSTEPALQPRRPAYRCCYPRQRSAKRLGRMRLDHTLRSAAAKRTARCTVRPRSRQENVIGIARVVAEHSDRHSDRLTEHDKGPSCRVLAAAACRARDDPGGGSRVAAYRFSDAALG